MSTYFRPAFKLQSLFYLHFILYVGFSFSENLKGVLHLLPQKAPKLACFVLYLKIINIFLKNNIRILQ